MISADADVVVVGGSVAGTAIARWLGDAGHHVILLEKDHFPRDKPCGEGIMPTGVRLLDQWGLLNCIPSSRRHPIRGVRFLAENGASIQGQFLDAGDGHHTGIGVRRLVLDELLLRSVALHPNIDVREGEVAHDLCPNGRRGMEIITRTGCYRGRIVVGADGIHSLVRRRLGLSVTRGRRQRFGVRTHFQFSDPQPLEDYVCVRLNRRHQCFTTPTGDGELQVSLLLEKADMKSFGGRLEQAFHESLSCYPQLLRLLRGARPISPVVACGPFDVWPVCRVADRAVLVGDAGGYLDPITGEGISLALQSATWAADVVDDALRRDDLSARRLLAYDQGFKRATRHHLWLTRILLSITRQPQVADWVVAKLSSCPELYTKLLGVNCGVRSLTDVPTLDWLRFLLASSRTESASRGNVTEAI